MYIFLVQVEYWMNACDNSTRQIYLCVGYSVYEMQVYVRAIWLNSNVQLSDVPCFI